MEYRTGAKVFDHWTIVKIIGEGANGKVYEIQKNTDGSNNRAALKVIQIPKTSSDVKEVMNEGMDEYSAKAYFQGFAKEIIKEIELGTTLKNHPNIASCEEYCVMRQEDGIGSEVLIRTELLVSLQDYLSMNDSNLEMVVTLGKEIASALEAVHNKGMLHGNVNLNNILYSATGQFILEDTGITRIMNKVMGRASGYGTENYMAPEVYHGTPYGESADLYSLGLVLYKLMNHNRLPFMPQGNQPVQPSDREKALKQRMSGTTMPKPAYASGRLSQIILKTCAYDPKERYQTAGEMLEDLGKLDVDGSCGDMPVRHSVEPLAEKPKSAEAPAEILAEKSAEAPVETPAEIPVGASVSSNKYSQMVWSERETQRGKSREMEDALWITPPPSKKEKQQKRKSAYGANQQEQKPRKNKGIIAAVAAIACVVVIGGGVAVGYRVGQKKEQVGKDSSVEKAEVEETKGGTEGETESTLEVTLEPTEEITPEVLEPQEAWEAVLYRFDENCDLNDFFEIQSVDKLESLLTTRNFSKQKDSTSGGLRWKKRSNDPRIEIGFHCNNTGIDLTTGKNSLDIFWRYKEDEDSNQASQTLEDTTPEIIKQVIGKGNTVFREKMQITTEMLNWLMDNGTDTPNKDGIMYKASWDDWTVEYTVSSDENDIYYKILNQKDAINFVAHLFELDGENMCVRFVDIGKNILVFKSEI